MNVAVIGANGQLGADLMRVLGETDGYTPCPLTHDLIEVTDPRSVHAALDRARPDVVVNCAAYHRVDECEDRPEEAMRVNALGALHVARACARLSAVCVHISTDYVFGGRGRGPYAEDDPAHPVNVYGVSKLAGEHLVAQSCPRWLVVRVASLFGTTPSRAKRKNFVETVLAKAGARERITVVDDIRMSPTYAYDAARGLESLIRRGSHGIAHLANAGSCTWHEFAVRIVACAGLTADIAPIHSSAYPSRACRPGDSSLRSLRNEEAVRRGLRPWSDALSAYLVERNALAAMDDRQ